MLTNVREASAMLALTLLVVSVRTIFVYLTHARTNVCPEGQTRVDGSGPREIPLVTLTRPFSG